MWEIFLLHTERNRIKFNMIQKAPAFIYSSLCSFEKVFFTGHYYFSVIGIYKNIFKCIISDVKQISHIVCQC